MPSLKLSQENLLHRTRLETMTEIIDTNVKTAWTATQAAIAQFESQTEAKLQHPDGGYAIV
jgi:NADP-dependent 3-hydroxy acid dehydrogenase YdfG